MSNILILDDDQDLLSIVKSLLRKKGFEVWAYSDWHKAWENIKKNKPHLILLDVFLKGMDGMDVCKKLKSISITKPLETIKQLVRYTKKKVKPKRIKNYVQNDGVLLTLARMHPYTPPQLWMWLWMRVLA